MGQRRKPAADDVRFVSVSGRLGSHLLHRWYHPEADCATHWRCQHPQRWLAVMTACQWSKTAISPRFQECDIVEKVCPDICPEPTVKESLRVQRGTHHRDHEHGAGRPGVAGGTPAPLLGSWKGIPAHAEPVDERACILYQRAAKPRSCGCAGGKLGG
jgi:hypothetical protein